MREENRQKGIVPYVIGVVGGVSSFIYGMKRDDALIKKSINSIKNPEEKTRIRALVSQEKKRPEYPYISGKLRGELLRISNTPSILPPRMQSPLAFCVAGGLVTFLGAVAIMNKMSQYSERDIGLRSTNDQSTISL